MGDPGFSTRASWQEGEKDTRLRKKSVDAHGILRAEEDFTVGDGGGDEFVAGAALVSATGSLVGIVKLIREIGGVVGVEYCGISVFMRPDDGVGSAVGRNGRSGAGIGKRDARL